MEEYRITIEEQTGAVIEEDVVEAEHPLDALRIYADDHGWKPEKDTLDPVADGRWEMTESDDTRIVVTAI